MRGSCVHVGVKRRKDRVAHARLGGDDGDGMDHDIGSPTWWSAAFLPEAAAPEKLRTGRGSVRCGADAP
jgi:hypothetical protein